MRFFVCSLSVMGAWLTIASPVLVKHMSTACKQSEVWDRLSQSVAASLAYNVLPIHLSISRFLSPRCRHASGADGCTGGIGYSRERMAVVSVGVALRMERMRVGEGADRR
jgi:hypothetical protein